MTEHALILTVPITAEPVGTPSEQETLGRLIPKLDQIITSMAIGEYDGYEFGDMKCTLYMYGPNADTLYNAIEPVLKSVDLPQGSMVLKRFGAANDVNVRKVKFSL